MRTILMWAKNVKFKGIGKEILVKSALRTYFAEYRHKATESIDISGEILTLVQFDKDLH
ncbi:MAG: hypothetical protein P8J18_05505 [Halieaceae bacterium]|nr:hypothetical protein [Halieaceae bacterium]